VSFGICVVANFVGPGYLYDALSTLARLGMLLTPGADFGRIEFGLGCDPVEDGCPEAIGGGWVIALCWTVCYSDDIYNN